MCNYWVVGKRWNDEEQGNRFYNLGKWEMGWAENDNPKYDNKIKQIKAGDRIAIKHMDGQGQTTITIVALGIVKGIEDNIVYVNWIETGLNRKVESKGCFGTIHGPYNYDDEWTRKVFCL